jgi:hypothetical protein
VPTAGKYGRRTPKGAPALMLGRLLTGVVPPVPDREDYIAAVGGGWKMLGNGPDPENAANGVPADGAGDCVSVTWATERRLMTAILAGAEEYPSLAQVVQFYKTQNPGFPGQDDGMDIQTALEDLEKSGGPDGVVAVAFAKVDHTNEAEVDAAIAIFGAVWCGVNVQDANQDEFSDSQPWDHVKGSPVDGGHSFMAGGYGTGGIGALSGKTRFETWAAETSMTAAFLAQSVEEMWVVIWPEHFGSKAFLAGVDLDQLAADYQEITGKTIVVPEPSPVPVPVPPSPVPTPDPTPPDVLTQASADLAAVLHEHVRWLHEHHLTATAKAVADACRQFLTTTGL